MADVIVPVSRSLFLCDSYAGHPGGRVDLTGIFTTIRPALYPHVRRFVAFAQLSGGLGNTPLFFTIRRDWDDELIRTTTERTIRFIDRVAPVNVAMTLEEVRFSEAGMYSVSLFCHNTWVCDTAVMLV